MLDSWFVTATPQYTGGKGRRGWKEKIDSLQNNCQAKFNLRE